MCLAIPHRIVAITDGRTCRARAGNVEVLVRTDLLSSVQIGDSILVHAGFAIEKLQEEDGQELESLWEEIRALEATLSPEPASDSAGISLGLSDDSERMNNA
jgi:hydrogenase expression/formation protein HypC